MSEIKFLKVKKKPVEVEAFEITQDFIDSLKLNPDEYDKCKKIFNINGRNVCFSQIDYDNPMIIIDTLEGKMSAKVNDWLIKGINGEIYACKPDIFKKTYDIELGERLE